MELADQGSGHPDMGLYAAKQVQKGKPRQGQVPERGVVEVKSVQTALGGAEVREQVDRYRAHYRLVLATNLREFELVGRTAAGEEVKLEAFRLAASEAGFDRLLETPRASAQRCGAGLGEYLARALSHRAALADPKDLAWLLASYARDGLARVERAGASPSLASVRSALEEALGVRFEGAKGARFFHSTLVQTLFYGVFSAWVLWLRQAPPRGEVFDWRTAVWHLRAPVLRALFQQLADPGRLEPLGLVEVLDWTAAALNRVDRGAFFASFNEGEAVPYFYEPFLQAFDPALRKQLGVWYTPAEVVRYMVARVDKALRDDLEIPDGLAADNVYVLDPCCGTGAYVAEVLKRIAAKLEGRGLGALAGARVKQAATERVFGFEIMPAPFVIAHLQVGLTMQELWSSPGRGGRRTSGGLPDECADRLGAAVEQAAAVPGTGRGARSGGEGEAGGADSRDPRQSAVQRLPGHGDGGRTRTDRRLPRDEARAQARGPGPERSLRALLPHGGEAHRREDRAGRRLLHFELLLAGRSLVHRHEGAVRRSLRLRTDRLSETATSTRPARLRPTVPRTRASSRPRAIAWASRSAQRSLRWSGRRTTIRRRRFTSGISGVGGSARTCWRRPMQSRRRSTRGSNRPCHSECPSCERRSTNAGSIGRPCRSCSRCASTEC